MNNTIHIDREALEAVTANLRFVVQTIENLLLQCPCDQCSSQDYFDD